MPEKITSAAIKIALAEKHWKDFFLTEVKSGPTQLAMPGGLKILDGLAIRKSWTNPCFTGYEVKISRGDFLRDAKFYTYEELCNCLYIVCPKGMIERTELPESVGLMYYDPEKKTITTKKKAISRKIEYSPEMLLYIIFSRLDSDRYPFFSGKREYFEAYLAGKKDNRDLARAVKTKLVQDNARLESALGNVEAFRQNYEIYRAVQDVMHKHGIWIFRADQAAQELDKALARKCPYDISEIRKSMEHMVDRAHQNAVKHGFWENSPEFGTAIALIHSELSEALEAARAGNPMIYYSGDNYTAPAPMKHCAKPEGVAIELADAVIRIADLCGQMKINLESAIALKMEYNEGRPFKHGKLF